MPAITKTPQNLESKKGFTLIEVMLVLGLTGLLLVGMLTGTFTAIAHQRYSDSVRSFAEYLRAVYSEVLSPESLGAGNSMSEAVFGKVLVFGYPYTDDPDDARAVFSATLIGDADIPISIDGDFMDELAAVNAHLYCGNTTADSSSTQDFYRPLWEASLAKANNTNSNEPFIGTVIIARAPTSGTVHTYFSDTLTYDLRDECTADNQTASGILKTDIQDRRDQFRQEAVGFCIKSENADVYREVRLAEDGRNTSAISILDTDSDIPGEENRCR